MGKKILWIIILVVILIALVVGLSLSKKQEAKVQTADTSFGKAAKEENTTSENSWQEALAEAKAEENETATNTVENTVSAEKASSSKGYVKTELADGVLYSIDGKQYKPDLVIDEKYYDTTIQDIWLNVNSYKGKKVEIEGMYLENKVSEKEKYTFVGRYSTSSLCPNCPPGYSYFEYSLDGKIDRELVDSKDWIKVIGTIEVGNDATTDYTDFYYLKVLSLEVMNEKGNDTVNN